MKNERMFFETMEIPDQSLVWEILKENINGLNEKYGFIYSELDKDAVSMRYKMSEIILYILYLAEKYGIDLREAIFDRLQAIEGKEND